VLIFDVELLHGTYRADPDGSAPTGRQTRGEWPPSPARLLAALIAADGTRDRCHRTTGSELSLLAAADPPVIHADPDPHHQPLHERYVAGQKREKGQQQEYPSRKGVLIRPGVRVAPRNPSVRFAYDIQVSIDDIAAIAYRAARVGYLGCADSPVKVTVARSSDFEASHGAAWTPDDEGAEVVNVHSRGDVERWQAAFDAWSEHGVTRGQARRHQPRAMYRHPDDPLPHPERGRVRVWLPFKRPVAGRQAAVVAHALKQAALSLYRGDPPAWLHGHINSSDEYQLARFLLLPDAGHRYSDGQLHGAAIWVPGGVNEEETRNLIAALLPISSLLLAGGRRIEIDRSRRVRTTKPRRWTRPAQRWVTVLPAVSDRHGRIDSAAVVRWCEQAGLPKPVKYRISRKPLLPGGIDLHPSETRRPGHSQNRPYAHVGLMFEEEIEGPVVIGAARSYGLGLCAPCGNAEREST